MDPSVAPLLFAQIDARVNRGRRFGIRPPDLLRHVYVVGKTGGGKSSLLEHLLVGEIRAGHGVALIDPHGDLAERVLDFVPPARLQDVVLIEPWNLARPVGLNLLDHVAPDERSRIASGVLATFHKVFADFWGPRLENVFRHTLLAVLEVPDATLLSVLRLLLDESYRARIVDRLTDPLVGFFWRKEFPTWPAIHRAETLAPVLNKVAAALASPVLRQMLGQPRSTIDIRAIMDQGHILVANLAKGRLGEDTSAFLGAVLVAKLQLAAYARADMRSDARRPFTLYIDEFQSFVTPAFGELLAEARKYGLGLVLAHQYQAQLDPGLQAAVLGNAGTLITFRLGANDAERLGPEFAPELTPEHLTRLGRHQIALRLAVDGLMSAPFTAETLVPLADCARDGHAATIRRISAERYGTPRADVARDVERQLGVRPAIPATQPPHAGHTRDRKRAADLPREVPGPTLRLPL